MVQQDTGKFDPASRGRTGIIYVPADLVKDTTFPFTNGDSVTIRIEADRLIIRKGNGRTNMRGNSQPVSELVFV
jgi:hypothetical protein